MCLNEVFDYGPLGPELQNVLFNFLVHQIALGTGLENAFLLALLGLKYRDTPRFFNERVKQKLMSIHSYRVLEDDRGAYKSGKQF